MHDFYGLTTMIFHHVADIAYFWLAVTEIIQFFSLSVTFEIILKHRWKLDKSKTENILKFQVLNTAGVGASCFSSVMFSAKVCSWYNWGSQCQILELCWSHDNVWERTSDQKRPLVIKRNLILLNWLFIHYNGINYRIPFQKQAWNWLQHTVLEAGVELLRQMSGKGECGVSWWFFGDISLHFRLWRRTTDILFSGFELVTTGRENTALFV